MEDTPPTQAGRNLPRSRDPEAAFSAAEQPPARRGGRRAAAPALTFQPPAAAAGADGPGRPSPRPPEGTEAGSPTAAAGPEPSESTPAPRSRPAAKARPAKATRPRKVAEATKPAKAEPAAAPESVDPTPAQPAADAIQPAKASPRKRAPRKKAAPKPAAATSTPAEPEAGAREGAATPPERAARDLVVPATPSRAGQEPAGRTAPERTGQPAGRARYTEAWAKLVADPGHTPELLALAAVQTLGPRARDWARRTREAYPAATDAGLARLATAQFTRFGSLGSVFGAVAGSYASIALLGAAALTHAELILHLAAAYGLDPADEERAVDLLVLTRVHPDRAAAEAAIAGAKQPAYEEGGVTGAAWRLGRMITAQTGGWTAARLVNRFFPGASLVAALLSIRASTEGVAHRARAYYSQASQPLGNRE